MRDRILIACVLLALVVGVWFPVLHKPAPAPLHQRMGAVLDQPSSPNSWVEGVVNGYPVAVTPQSLDGGGATVTVNNDAGMPVPGVEYGTYYASPPTLSDGGTTPSLTDSLGNAQTNLATKIAGEDLANDVLKAELRYSYTHQAGTTAGVTVKSGAGFLHALTINQPVASSVITLYDNTAASGTVISVVTLPATIVSGPATLTYNVSFVTGLELVIATGASDVTVSWR